MQHQEAAPSVPSNPPATLRYQPVAVESTPPPTRKTECSNRRSWPARLSMARSKPTVWFRITDPLTKSSATQMASDLRNSHRRNLETLRTSGVITGERWEAESGRDPSDTDPTHFYVWFRLVSPAPSAVIGSGVAR